MSDKSFSERYGPWAVIAGGSEGIGSAFAEHQEKVKGSLEPDKLADLAVLTQDIFRMPANDLDKARVYMTVFDGTVIYQLGNGNL